MKVVCFKAVYSDSMSIELILGNEGYEVEIVTSEEMLKSVVRGERYDKIVVIYQVDASNLNVCYRSLRWLRRIKAGYRVGVVVLAEQSLSSEGMEKLEGLTDAVMRRPVDFSQVLAKVKASAGRSDDGDDTMLEMLYTIQHQLVAIRGVLVSDECVGSERDGVLERLQAQLLELNKYLSRHKKLDEVSYVSVSKMLQKLLREFGWEEVEYRASGVLTKIETNYEYFSRAMEDLVEKLIRIAGEPQYLTITELAQNGYLIIHFTIHNVGLGKPCNLLNYRSFDFCHKVITLHAGDFFIKFDQDVAYVTLRIPVL